MCRIESESANTRAAEEYCYFSDDTQCYKVILWKNMSFTDTDTYILTSTKRFSNFVVTYHVNRDCLPCLHSNLFYTLK